MARTTWEIRCGATVIVTLNLGDFPAGTLRKFNMEAQHPDDFILALLETFPDLVIEADRNHRASLRDSSKTAEEYWSELDAQGIKKNCLRTS
jgi:hypothetical protein